MKCYFITYEETIGEFSHIGRAVQMAADDVPVDDVVNDFFGVFYGDKTTVTSGYKDKAWWDNDKCPQRLVKISSVREISKEDYEVLKRYL